MHGPLSLRVGRAAPAQLMCIWDFVNIEARTSPSGLAAKNTGNWRTLRELQLQ
jgi:hypothetical protein